MKKSIKVLVQVFVLLSLVLGAFGLGVVRPAQAQTTWNLVWSDEFNGSGAPSSTNWNYHVGNGYNAGAFAGWGNGEWEWYRPENCYQSGGNLVLRGDFNTSPTNIAGRNWYQRSCRLTTDTKRSVQYGKIEARIQMPNANGSWPAFWMMGDSCDDTSTSNYAAPISYYDVMATNWASCGEVDIMEHKNSETTVYNNIFWDLRTGVFPWTAGQNANYVTTYNSGNVNNFHTYSIEWDASYIRWFFDGTQTHVIDITPATLEEFRKPFHLILNLALGGAFPAMDPTQSQFPMYMNVDYVRVYQKGTGTGATATRTNTPVPGATATPVPSGDFSKSVTSLSSTSSRVTFVSNVNSTWVDIHYTGAPGLGQQNFRMARSGNTWTQTISGLSAGNVITYWFTYEKAGAAYDTAHYTFTK